MHRFFFAHAMLLIACSSKQRPHDEALKAQILSNDSKPIVLPPLPVDAALLHENADMRRAAFEPTARDMEKRAAHFGVKLKVQIDGGSGIGTRSEEHGWKRAPSGQFSVKHSNNGELIEWLVADKKAFVRHGKNEWRQKPHTLEHADVLKRDVVLPLGELMATFAPGLTVSEPKAARDNGRSAYRYTVGFEPKDGAKTGQTRGVPLTRDEVLPVSLEGEIVVDKDTGLVLTADLKAALALEPIVLAARPSSEPATEKTPPPPAQRTALKVKLSWSLDGLSADEGQKLESAVPENAAIDRGFDRPAPEIIGFFGGLKKTDKDEQHEEED